MPWRSRAESVLAVLALVVLFKVAHELYRWVAFSDERGRLRELSTSIDGVGVRVVRTQLRADSLQAVVEALDRGLDGARKALAEYEGRSVDGAIPERIYRAYRERLDAYNLVVRDRNARLTEWRTVVDSNHVASDRYNALADSMRAVAARMGEPYYPIPSPMELAVRHGVDPRAGRAPPK
jgi:hypothetical protein